MRYVAVVLLFLVAALAGPLPGRGQQGAPQQGVTAVVLKSMPPFFALGSDGQPQGFSADAARAIAERAGLEMTFLVADDWAEAQREVLEGRGTFIAGMTPTQERLDRFIFTSPIFVSPTCLMVRANDKTIKTLDDLQGRTLGILRGSLRPEELTRVPDIWIRDYTSPQHYLVDLLSGNLDAVLAGRYELEHLTSRAGVDNLVAFLDGPTMEYKRSLALTPENGALAQRLDAAVREFTASEQYTVLVERWYGKPRHFWTEGRVAATVGAVLAGAILVALALHYHLTLRLNDRLAAALDDSRRKTGELTRSRDLFRHLVENIRHVFWMRDLTTGRIIYASPAYEDISGRSVQSLYDDPTSFRAMIHPDDAPHVARALDALYEQGTPLEAEMRIVATSGEVRWVGARAFRLPAADSLPERTVGFLEDITASKTASLALQESERLFRALFMDSSVIMLLLAPDTGRIVEANHAASAYYGWSRDELKAMSVTDINTLPPEELRAAMAQARTENKCFFSFRHRLAHGETRDVEVYTGPVSIQGREALYSCIIDVTERRKAQALLRRSEEFQRAIVSCSPVALYSVGTDCRVLSWNASAERIFGWTAEEVLGKPLPIVDDDQQEEFRSLRERVLAGELLSGLELTRRRKDGSSIHISLSSAAIWSGGVPIGILGAAQDITARKQVEKDLLQAKEAAEAASQAKSEFLANMSHEIRTPLNGLMGMLQLLESTALRGEQGEYVDLAKQSCTRLTRLLSDILDLSRVEAGKLNIQAKPFSLTAVMDQIKGIFRPLARQSGLKFHCHVDAAVPRTLGGDEVRLMQVLMNLLGNAFKFTPTGSVTLEAYRLPPRAPGQCRVLFSVADTGIGIPEEDIERLFKPFSQISEGFTRRYQGAGLGLVICKRLVELMGGSIAVDSEPGLGTTMFFCCTFRAQEEPVLAAPAPAASPGPPLEGARVLVAEDDRVNGLAAARLLEKAGARPTVVGDGSQALEALGREPFDLVLMDVQMPVLDGVEATRAIRNGQADEAARGIPIVAMTAYAMAGDKENFLAAGMDGYVSKPVDPDELTRVIRETLARGGGWHRAGDRG